MYLAQEKRPVVCRLGRTYKNIVLRYKGCTCPGWDGGSKPSTALPNASAMVTARWSCDILLIVAQENTYST